MLWRLTRWAVNRLKPFRVGRRPVLPEEVREGGGTLTLRHRAGGHLTSCRWVRANDGDPDVLGSVNLLAMIAPLHRTTSPTRVGGDDKRGGAAILRNRLQRIPQVGDEGVDLMCRAKEKIVPP